MTDNTANATPKPFKELKCCFAVDISGSTAGHVLTSETTFVQTVGSQLNNYSSGSVIAWNNYAYEPQVLSDNYLRSLQGCGGTSPSSLLAIRTNSLRELKSSDMWFLITDGRVGQSEVVRFGQSIRARGLHGTPCVIIVFGPTRTLPKTCNISVGFAPFGMLNDCLVLYSSTDTQSSNVYILQAKGCFEPLVATTGQPEITMETTWQELPTLDSRFAFKDLPVTPKVELAEEELQLEGERVNTSSLWNNGWMPDDQLQRMLNNPRQQQQLAQTSHSTGTSNNLRDWLQTNSTSAPGAITQEQYETSTRGLVQQVASAIGQNWPVNQYNHLRQQVRSSHVQQRSSATATLARNRIISTTLNMINAADRGGYGADTLSVGATATVSTEPEFVEGDPSDLNSAFRGECPICCEQNNILALLIIDHASIHYTSIQQRPETIFPFSIGGNTKPDNKDLISSFITCYSCAKFLEKTPYNEPCAAGIPLVNYANNKEFWKKKMGEAGWIGKTIKPYQQIAVFISVLDHIYRTKTWAHLPPQNPHDPAMIHKFPLYVGSSARLSSSNLEQTTRAQAIVFALNTLITNTHLPRDMMLGRVCVEPQEAISALIKSSARNAPILSPDAGHDSVLFQNPITGFSCILRMAQFFNIIAFQPINDRFIMAKYDMLLQLVRIKTVHNITGRYMDHVSRSGYDGAKQVAVDFKWSVEMVGRRNLVSNAYIDFINSMGEGIRDEIMNKKESCELFEEVVRRLGRLEKGKIHRKVEDTVFEVVRA